MIHGVRKSQVSDGGEILNIAAKIGVSSQFNWKSHILLEELQQAETLVCVFENAVCAFLCYRQTPDHFEITVLATTPQLTKRGFQTALIQELQQLAAAADRNILLEVHEQNVAAQSLYRKLGFRELSIRRNYYRDGASAVVMTWTKA